MPFNMKYNGSVEPRKRSRSNLENLFAAITHLINLSTAPYRSALLGFSGILFNRITYLYSMDVTAFIAEIKLVRRWYIEFVREGDESNPGIPEERWNDTENCPALLQGLVEIYDKYMGSTPIKTMAFFNQVIFTLLQADRVVILPVSPLHFSITDPSRADADIVPSKELILKALKALGINKDEFKEVLAKEARDFEFEILSSNGPNGAATWTAHLDARAWSIYNELLTPFRAFLEECRLSRILRSLLGCIRSPENEVIPNLHPILGKLAYLEEWGGKSRIVAQVDYWTQMAMTPLHNTINHFLKRLVQDGTFNQDASAERVRKWTADPSIELFSHDLTAATDRLPINIQIAILNAITDSPTFGSNWALSLVGREFLTHNGDYIHYEVGQPMGARSSFPMLALTHHVIVQLAALKVNVQNYTSYAIIGDDNTMTNKTVSSAYTHIMDILGVDINKTKSISHIDKAYSAAELCKRVFVHGVELTTFNPKLLVKTILDGRLAPDLQNDLLNRGWDPGQDVFWKFMAGILDKDNLTLLIKLNISPIAISGLHTQIKPNTKLTNLELWLPNYKLIERDLIELFTYITASEQLKRLDAILRASTRLNDAISILSVSNANPRAIPQYVRDAWLTSDLTKGELSHLEQIISKTGSITPFHPIVSAARAEGNRISELLHALNALDTNMVNSARLGLLDMFHTSLASIWFGEDSTRVQAVRSLFTKTLSTLISVFTSDKRVVDGTRDLSLNYSVVLTTLGKLWSVSFKFGGTTQVNALRASVTRNIDTASSTLSTALDSLSIVPASQPSSAPKAQSQGRSARRFRRR